MAQWSHSDKTLYVKLVYYGPAFGGKTTNLETLHRLTDPAGAQRLLSVKTEGDRTLFFDLLPFDLGTILGYQVAMKLYTVPGQVRYDTTRQIVLAGADAIVFVGDSSASREDQNRWSLQNLVMNMRVKGLDRSRVPVIYQFNKQDLPDAARPREVAAWLGTDPEKGIPAVATEGHGVLETFATATKALLHGVVSQADRRTRESLDPDELGRHVDKAFAPFMNRVIEAPAGDGVAPHSDQIVFDGKDLLADAVQAGTELGERLGDAVARAGRQQRELDALRQMSESLVSMGACFEAERVVDAALETAARILEAGAVSLIRREPLEDPLVERCWGRVQEPLIGSLEGMQLLERMISDPEASVVDELLGELTTPAALEPLSGLRAAACVPLGEQSKRYMVAYAPAPDGRFSADDLRFLRTLAAHLAVALDQIRLHQEVATHRDELEATVKKRTVALRRAYNELKEMELTKDRLLTNLSHEMRTPLTAILGAATFMRDYRSNATQRTELTGSILESAETLQVHLDQLLRLAECEEEAGLELAATTTRELIETSVGLCESTKIEARYPAVDESIRLDLPRTSRAIGHLLDNAVKFSPQDGAVELELELTGNGVEISVSDRGPGVDPRDRERIFLLFEQGGDLNTAKPKGLGVGLYEANLIAKQHGGSLNHEDREGGGSRFVLRIPAVRIDVAEAEPTHV